MTSSGWRSGSPSCSSSVRRRDPTEVRRYAEPMLTVGGAPVHRFTVDDLTAMVEAGVLPEARGIELELLG